MKKYAVIERFAQYLDDEGNRKTYVYGFSDTLLGAERIQHQWEDGIDHKPYIYLAEHVCWGSEEENPIWLCETPTFDEELYQDFLNHNGYGNRFFSQWEKEKKKEIRKQERSAKHHEAQ